MKVDEMMRGASTNQTTGLAVYAELRPIDRHRAFVDHLFILWDRGRLTGIGRNLFASPLSEITLVGRPLDDRGEDRGGQDRSGTDLGETVAWKTSHLPPRFGRRPRRRSFHGWMLGIRYRPLDLDMADAALAGLSEVFNAEFAQMRENPFDPIVGALDAWIEHHLSRGYGAAEARRSSITESHAALDGALSEAGPDRSVRVASLAAAAGVAPRTLQRHFRKHTGLAPKRYAAVERFSSALKQVALERGNLADVAAEAGYCDQAHLTADLGRHAGFSPGRFRELARQQVVPDAVRFFKDADLANRVRLLVCDSGVSDDEVTDGEVQSQGCKLRRACSDKLRAPDRDGDLGH
jgi:AraC-like DNA-binding protein